MNQQRHHITCILQKRFPCHIFRLYGRILKPHFGLPRDRPKTVLLDFGCGQGASVNFFHSVGFDAWGVDMSGTDIAVAKARYPEIADRFSACDPDPKTAVYLHKQVDVVTASQSLFYFSKYDFSVILQKFYDIMPRRGEVIFASMMSKEYKKFYDNSMATEDEWLREVNFRTQRISVEKYYMFFVDNHRDLCRKFHLFKPVFTGQYTYELRQDEAPSPMLTFVGVKE